MNSPYQEIYDIYGKPDISDIERVTSKFESKPWNIDIQESYFTHIVCLISYYLLTNGFKEKILEIRLCEELKKYRWLVKEIVWWNDILGDKQWLKIFLWKSISNLEDTQIDSLSPEDYDMIFSIQEVEKKVNNVIYLTTECKK